VHRTQALHPAGGLASVGNWVVALVILPPIVITLLLLGCFDALEAYRYGRVVLSHFAWPMLLSPACYLWFSVSLASIVLPFQGLAFIRVLFNPGVQEYKHRYRRSVVTFAFVILLIFLTLVVAWGSFPLDTDSAGAIHLRMIPFLPLPSQPLF